MQTLGMGLLQSNVWLMQGGGRGERVLLALYDEDAHRAVRC